MFPIKHERSLDFLDGTPESRQEHCHKSTGSLRLPQQCKNSSEYPKSTRDEDRFPCIGSRGILHSLSNMTSGLSSFRQLQRFPENTIPGLEELQVQHSNSRKAPGTPNRLKMRADSLGWTQGVCPLSTSTSRGGFSQQQVCESDPEFAASSGMDTKMPCLERRLDIPAVA